MKTIFPGGTIGILGDGQLGRMLALEAKRMAYNVIVLSPESEPPAGQVADVQIQADYTDKNALRRFSDAVDVATIEFENIPVEALEQIEQSVAVRPGSKVLQIAQNRKLEKTFLRSNNFPIAPFHCVQNEQDFDSIGHGDFPAILKTSASGYDGKGQQFVQTHEQLHSAWEALGRVECVLEAFVDFEWEFSVIVASNGSAIKHYDPIRNEHHNHILDVSTSPSRLPEQACREATDVARGIAKKLQFAGVMCVEFFLDRDGAAIVNEIAPRPHNSGHLTIEGHDTNQFQQQIRAVCNLPLGSTKQRTPAAMANLFGDVWAKGIPRWDSVLGNSGTNLHLYGKQAARAGRKMGHITCIGPTVEDAVASAIRARNACTAEPASNRSDFDQPAPSNGAEFVVQ